MKLTRKVRPSAIIKIDSYKLVSRAVEEGINYGIQRSRKYSDAPSEETLKQEIEKGVMNALSEIFIWPDVYEE